LTELILIGKGKNEVNWEQEKKAALIAALNIIFYKNLI